MTIYVDDFSEIRASRDLAAGHGLSCRVSLMIGTDPDELHRFAAKIGALRHWYQDRSHYYVLPVPEASKAELLGAVLVRAVQLSAMISLRHLGEDMEPHYTAPARLASIARMAAVGTSFPGREL